MNVLNKIRSKNSKESSTQSEGKQHDNSLSEKSVEVVSSHNDTLLSNTQHRKLSSLNSKNNNINQKPTNILGSDNLAYQTIIKLPRNSNISSSSKNQLLYLSEIKSDDFSLQSNSQQIPFSYQKILSDEKIKGGESQIVNYNLQNQKQIFEMLIEKSYQLGNVIVFEGTIYRFKMHDFISTELKKNSIQQFRQYIEQFISQCSHNSKYLLGVVKKNSNKAEKYFQRQKEVILSDSIDNMHKINSLESISRLYSSNLIQIGTNQYILGKNTFIKLVQKKSTGFKQSN